MSSPLHGIMLGYSSDLDGGSSQLEQISEAIRKLEEFEFGVAVCLGSSQKDIDFVVILNEVNKRWHNNPDYMMIVQKLYKLRNLRQVYSSLQNELPVNLEVCPSLLGAPHRVDASRFWAVLIGINEYASNPLQGCVPDVQLMEQYLTQGLGVPNNRIQLLLGSEEHTSPDDPLYPSRSHIVGTLLSLITNSEIAYGDNIIIYYSGHGSYYLDHTEDDKEPKYIQTLCPIDRDTLDTNGHPVPNISNQEFHTILSLICRTKGHCITVILDCCYSGGVSRSLPELGVHASPAITYATVKDTLVVGENNLTHFAGYHSILADDWCSDMDSHVLLAACKDYQLAKAKKVRREDGSTPGYIGIFTDSLVGVLRSGCYQKDTTYADLPGYIVQSSHQTPVVAGKHKNMRLWFQR